MFRYLINAPVNKVEKEAARKCKELGCPKRVVVYVRVRVLREEMGTTVTYYMKK